MKKKLKTPCRNEALERELTIESLERELAIYKKIAQDYYDLMMAILENKIPPVIINPVIPSEPWNAPKNPWDYPPQTPPWILPQTYCSNRGANDQTKQNSD